MAGIEAIMGAAAVPALLRESLEGLKTVKKHPKQCYDQNVCCGRATSQVCHRI